MSRSTSRRALLGAAKPGHQGVDVCEASLVGRDDVELGAERRMRLIKGFEAAGHISSGP